MVEWGSGQKKIILESRVREVVDNEDTSTTRPTRRTRGNANDKATTAATAKVKRENISIKAEYAGATDDEEFATNVSKPSIKRVKEENASIKAEYDGATDEEEEQTSEVRDVSKSKAWRETNKVASSLKPQFEVEFEVYAAFWDNDEREGTNSWYPGKVASYKVVKKRGKLGYGQSRLYSINFDDGDFIENLGEHFVMSKEDYDLPQREKWLGVRNETDDACNDNWAKHIGWYVADIDGEEVAYTYLSNAINAYDEAIVRRHGKRTKKIQLNMPENYPMLFPQNSEHDDGESDQKEPASIIISQTSSDEELAETTQTNDDDDQENNLPLIPKPGLNGCPVGVLTGPKIVLTGNWPELYDGRREREFNKGKGRLEDIIEAFGGTKAKSITVRDPPDFILVGNAPGRGKITTANEKEIPMINRQTLWKVLMGQLSIKEASHHSIKVDSIKEFSNGDDYFKLGFKVNKSTTPKKKKQTKIQSTTLDHFFVKTGDSSSKRTPI